jgi:hypothetical protein
MSGASRNARGCRRIRRIDPHRVECKLDSKRDQPLVRGDDAKTRRLSDECESAVWQNPRSGDFPGAGECVLLAESSD